MYNFKEIEKKWQNYWKENNTFKVDIWDFSKPKYYNHTSFLKIFHSFPLPLDESSNTPHQIFYDPDDQLTHNSQFRGLYHIHRYIYIDHDHSQFENIFITPKRNPIPISNHLLFHHKSCSPKKLFSVSVCSSFKSGNFI